MPVVVVLIPLFATLTFLSPSLRRLGTHQISSTLAYDGDAASSSSTNEGLLGMTVTGPGGVCVSACIDGDI